MPKTTVHGGASNAADLPIDAPVDVPETAVALATEPVTVTEPEPAAEPEAAQETEPTEDTPAPPRRSRKTATGG